MTDIGLRPGETAEEWRERLKCLESNSTKFALRHREDNAPSDVPLLSDGILSKPELAELTGLPLEEIADAFDPVGYEGSAG